MESPTRLFNREKLKKFLSIMDGLKWKVNDKADIYSKPNKLISERDVFVRRTIHRWFRSKHLVLYRMSKIGCIYKQYLFISSIQHISVYGKIRFRLDGIDYAKLHDEFPSTICFDDKELLMLEGKFQDDETETGQLMKLLSIDNLPDNEYLFKALKNGKKILLSVTAKTEALAHKYKPEIEKNEGVVAGELIEVKPLKRKDEKK